MCDLYIKCPRCKGGRQVYAYTRLGDGYLASQGEHFPCPLCRGTGEADADEAKEWVEEQAEEA